MNYKLLATVVLGAVFVTIIIVLITRHSSDNGGGSDKPKHQIFSEVKGLSGSGFCYGKGNSFEAHDFFKENTLEACQDRCKQDNDCSAISYMNDTKDCIVYKPDGQSPATKGWKKSDGDKFPTYASPYYGCPYPLPKNGCTVDFPGSCTKDVQGNPIMAQNVSCWIKNKSKENYTSFKVNVAPEDDSHIQIVLSNPFLYGYDLMDVENSFYNWFLDLIDNAEKFLTLCNAYITLGKYQSDDPSDVQSVIAVHLTNRLKAKPQLKVFLISVGYDQGDCQMAVREQAIYKPFFDNGQMTYIDFSQGGIPFFHDKLYISDKKAYIGGQNMSGSSSIDFGLSASNKSPLYNDLYLRSVWFYNKGVNNPDPNYTLKFKYTVEQPFMSGTTGYFVVTSPTFPLCTNPASPWYPKQACDITAKSGPCPGPGGKAEWNTHVSYEHAHILDIISNANTFINMTNYEMSAFGNLPNGNTQTGYDWSILNALMDRAKAGVDIDFWISNSPFSDKVRGGENAICSFLRCNEGRNWLNQTKQYSNFKIHWWYQTPGTTGFSNCHPLHAKIFYTDAGLLVTSANLTTDYFGNTPNTGIAAVFHDHKPPNWVKVGLNSIFQLLKDNSSIKYNDKTYQCDQSKPNFETKDEHGKSMCDPQNGCTGTCQSCKGAQFRPNEWKWSCQNCQ